jgi:hypothetical protein
MPIEYLNLPEIIGPIPPFAPLDIEQNVLQRQETLMDPLHTAQLQLTTLLYA